MDTQKKRNKSTEIKKWKDSSRLKKGKGKKSPGQIKEVLRPRASLGLSQRGGGEEKKKTKLLVTETDEPALHNFVGNMGFFPIGEIDSRLQFWDIWEKWNGDESKKVEKVEKVEDRKEMQRNVHAPWVMATWGELF